MMAWKGVVGQLGWGRWSKEVEGGVWRLSGWGIVGHGDFIYKTVV